MTVGAQKPDVLQSGSELVSYSPNRTEALKTIYYNHAKSSYHSSFETYLYQYESDCHAIFFILPDNFVIIFFFFSQLILYLRIMNDNDKLMNVDS